MPKQSDPSSDRAINAPEGEASSPASEPASPSSEGFIADPGPAFDAEAAAKEPGPELPTPELQVELEAWEEEVVQSLLGLKGRVLHAGVGVAEQDWLYTELDLAAIAPPLTRILNRYPAVRAYAAYGDPITLLTAFSAYATRSLLERRRAIEAAAALETEQTIEPLEPDTGPVPAAATPPPPPMQRPDPLPAAGAVPPSPAPSTRDTSPRRRRPGEAEVDPEEVEWRVGG